MVSLIYLDWIARSQLVRVLYNVRSSIRPASPKFQHDNSDIENEQHLSREEQVELLHKRISSILECLDVFERYEPSIRELTRRFLVHSSSGCRRSYLSNAFCRLTDSCECNFRHKLLLIKAECARVSLILGSTAIFKRERGGQRGAEEIGKQDFEETMELYEAAIQSARTHGFTQYEIVGLESYALFWLTAPSRPKEQVASGYVRRSQTYSKF